MNARLANGLALITALASWTVSVAQDGTATHRKASPFVFTVEASGPAGRVQGSAVAAFNGLNPTTKVPSSTWLATNEHVVRAASSVLVRQGTKTYKGVVQYRNDSLDLAFIVIESDVLPTAEIVPSDQVQIGQRVFAIGSPLGLESSISEGIVSGKRAIAGVLLIQTTAPISPGNSGGGLFDVDGKLLGITTFRLREGQNINFAVEAELVRHVQGAITARDLLKLYYEKQNAPAHILGLLDSRLDTWLATTDSGSRSRRYKEVLDVFAQAIARRIDPNLAAGRISDVMHAYEKAIADTTPRSSGSSSLGGDAATTVLACDLDLGSRGKRNVTFAVDFGRKLVNGNPAQFHEDRIVIGEGSVRLEINRYSGLVMGFSDKQQFAQTVGTCKRVANRQF